MIKSTNPVSLYENLSNWFFHCCPHGSRTYVWSLWLFDLVELRYSFNVHAWLPLCMAIWIGILKNPDAPFKCWKEDCRLAITHFYSLWLLPHSNAMINHGLRGLVRGLWVWQWIFPFLNTAWFCKYHFGSIEFYQKSHLDDYKYISFDIFCDHLESCIFMMNPGLI